jgi:hypothetical protein
MNRTVWTTLLGSAAAVLISSSASAATFNDNFALPLDYGTGQIGSIWTGSHSMGNLGAGGVFAASPASDPGRLLVDFDGNLGWEGDQSDAPFLFVNVAGTQDYTAEVTIAAQTSGQWSDAGLVARAKQGTPPGTGADHADEHAIFFGSFRTDAAVPDSGSTLFKRIEAGAQVMDAGVAINPGAGNLEPLPIRLRLVKSGSTYTGFVSPDNGITWQQQSTSTAPAGTPLADSSIAQEVGISFASFSATLLGSASFDDFSLVTVPEPATAGIVLLGLLGLTPVARRRRAG